jgi:serine/threonine-protein kinase SRPK3
MIPIVTNNFVDLQERNIILGIEDDSILEEFERSELRHPSPRKVDGDGTIYKSRSLVITKNPGRPVITDFGEARVGQQTYDDDIQPFQYRAPEVIMDMPWSYEVDIWNVGVMVSASPCSIPFVRAFN